MLPTGELSTGLAAAAALLMARAEAMGLVRVHDSDRFDTELLHQVLEAMSRSGIGRSVLDSDDLKRIPRDYFEILNQSLEASPYPEGEWGSVLDVIDVSTVAELVGIEHESIQEFASGNRTTPDAVALRLHFLALILADLLGSYNRYGIRRWFERPRKALGGVSPRQILDNGEWSPEDAGARRVALLARSLRSLGAA